MGAFLSVIVPYSNQDETRLPALKTMLGCLREQDYMITDHNHNPTDKKSFEVIFIEQKTHPEYKTVDTFGIPDKHIVVDYPGEFNKSWIMNVAAREAKGGILVFMDADMIFGKEYLYYVNLWRQNTHPNPKFFVGWDWIIKLPGRDEPNVRMVRTTALTAGGVFWIDTDFYWEVGGMNENYFGYGGEDNDFWVRANVILGKKNHKNVLNAPYPMAHIYHDCAVASPNRFYPLNRTIQFPQLITERLKRERLGKTEGPTLIKLDDIKLAEDGIEQGKLSKGMVDA